MYRMIVAALLLGALTSTLADVFVARFSQRDLTAWQEKSFAGQTQYFFSQANGKPALRADSQAAASGLYNEITVDLNITPFINWSWQVENILNGVDEKTKSGDDFPARVYVVVSGGLQFWKTRSLVYVWSSTQPQDSAWENPFTANARHIAVRSGAADVGQWLTEKRNIRDDFKRVFGEDVHTIDAVAIMTDTDNSGQQATAWYGDIFFSED